VNGLLGVMAGVAEDAECDCGHAALEHTPCCGCCSICGNVACSEFGPTMAAPGGER
jgi:hypothetical protein